MKPVIIITISTLLIAVAFAAIIILNPFDEGLDDLPNILNQYDCATTFDSLSLDTIAFDENGVIPRPGAMNHYQGLFEMMDNRCWITMDSWIDNSNYNSFKQKINYEYQFALSSKAEQNQLILGELTCKDIQKNPSQYYFGQNFDLERCEYGIDVMVNRLNGIPNSPEMNELRDKFAKSETPFELEAIYSDSGNVEISFLDTSGKTDSVILKILGLEDPYQKSFSDYKFIQKIKFRNIPEYGWPMHPIVLEIEHSELGHIQLKTEIHPQDEPIPSVIYSGP